MIVIAFTLIEANSTEASLEGDVLLGERRQTSTDAPLQSASLHSLKHACVHTHTNKHPPSPQTRTEGGEGQREDDVTSVDS